MPVFFLLFCSISQFNRWKLQQKTASFHSLLTTICYCGGQKTGFFATIEGENYIQWRTIAIKPSVSHILHTLAVSTIPFHSRFCHKNGTIESVEQFERKCKVCKRFYKRCFTFQTIERESRHTN